MFDLNSINYETREAVTQLLEIAKAEVPKLHSGEIIILADLFKGYEWKRIPPTQRKLLGRYFLDYCDTKEGKEYMEVLDKTKTHQQMYARKSTT